jgi:hypothetical protein
MEMVEFVPQRFCTDPEKSTMLVKNRKARY